MCPSDRGLVGAADGTGVSINYVSSCLVCSCRGPGLAECFDVAWETCGL